MKLISLRTGRGRMAASGALLAALGPCATWMSAHGFEGDRFFPPTIATDDPFATDELLLPAVSFFKSPAADGNPSVGTTDIG